MPLDEDVARVEAVRQAIGSEGELLVDGNHSWKPYEAIRFGRAIEQYQPLLAGGTRVAVGLPGDAPR